MKTNGMCTKFRVLKCASSIECYWVPNNDTRMVALTWLRILFGKILYKFCTWLKINGHNSDLVMHYTDLVWRMKNCREKLVLVVHM